MHDQPSLGWRRNSREGADHPDICMEYTKPVTCELLQRESDLGRLLVRGARAKGHPDSTLDKGTLYCHPSPNTIMSPPKSLGLALAACFCVAAARQSLSNFPDDCAFTVDRSQYNLCPLFLDRGQNRVVKVHADLTPNTQLLYEISFNGPLSAQSGEEAEREPRVSTERCGAL